MKQAFEKVLAFTHAHGMFRDARGVLVAVSGGPDSIALLDLLIRILDRNIEVEQPSEPGTTPPLHLAVAHLDDRMRDESARDAEFVRSLAEKHGLPVGIEAADVRGAAAEANARAVVDAAAASGARFFDSSSE